MKKPIPTSDLVRENAELRLHIRELEAYIDELKTSGSESVVLPSDSTQINMKKKLELLLEAQLYCKSGYLVITSNREVIECSEYIKELFELPKENPLLSFSDF